MSLGTYLIVLGLCLALVTLVARVLGRWTKGHTTRVAVAGVGVVTFAGFMGVVPPAASQGSDAHAALSIGLQLAVGLAVLIQAVFASAAPNGNP